MNWPPRTLGIRTRGDREHGWGHVVRLAHLALLAKARYGGSLSVHMFVECDDKVFQYLSEFDIELVRLPMNILLEDELQVASTFPQHELFIIDMLESTADRQRAWKKRCGLLVLLDELCQHQHESDVVVCAQILPDYPNYRPENMQVSYCKGPEFFILPLMPDVSYSSSRVPHTGDSPFRVLVMIGGGGFYADGYRLAAEALSEVNRTLNLEPTFVLGYDYDAKTESLIRTILPDATILGGVEQPMEIMAKADFGIFSGGYSKYEAAHVGLPIIMLSVQEHQIAIAEAFARTGAGLYLGPADQVSTKKLTTQILNFISEPDLCRQMGFAGSELIDGRGAERLFDRIDDIAAMEISSGVSDEN
jgi:spore coat polysaccharide biosynthesis predicted glycosyltransferase SpsG